MTNGHGAAAMASFMTKKKKYKFQVDVRLDELLEVPFVSAVLFAKLRLLDGGNFQDCSSRQEVRDHVVKWDAHYSFPCKMMANASTGILERCVLRVSVRKECKGGRSFTKLGFVDLNLAEFAGAGETSRKALLEGYDTKHRSDNSMLRFSIKMNMLSGDILFKAPSPSLKHKSVPSSEDAAVVVLEPSSSGGGGGGTSDEYSNSGAAAAGGGSVASGTSSGFGSLPKKRSALLSSDLVIGHTLAEGGPPGPPITTTTTTSTTTMTAAVHATDCFCPEAASTTITLTTTSITNNIVSSLAALEQEDFSSEQGHSRNSSNTSQMSKASGYSSAHSHSRQSSSGGDSGGHIRNPSSGSLVLSETGSLDRAKAALERRKKTQPQEQEVTAPGRVECTRVNTDHLIDELIKNTNLEQAADDDSAESSGLQLFIAKDGTAALGSHEVKSQMSAGVFKQVVMEDSNR